MLTIVLNEPLQPLTTESDPSHPTGFFRDGYCWGSPQDPGKHYIGAVVTDQFLQYSKEKGTCLRYLPFVPMRTNQRNIEKRADSRERPYDPPTWICWIEGRM